MEKETHCSHYFVPLPLLQPNLTLQIIRAAQDTCDLSYLISAKIRQCAAPTRVQTDSHVKGTVLSMRRHGLQRTQKTD